MLTVILRATLSSWEASSLILWTIRRSGPPSMGGSERWARMVLPETKCSCTAAWSFFSASKPCHTIGYFWREKGFIFIIITLRNAWRKKKNQKTKNMSSVFTVRSCTVSMERCPACSNLASGRGCAVLAAGTVGAGVDRKDGGPFCRERSDVWARLFGDVIGDW